MNTISHAAARRYRIQHASLVACVPVAFVGALLPRILPPPPPNWLFFVAAAWFFLFLAVGLIGLWLFERRLIRVINPDPETRREVVSLSWFRPFGTFMAVNELLRRAESK